MEEILYKVFAMLDENKCITDIWSTGNQCLGDKRTIEEMKELGYVQIDEGANGEIYGRAQVNYLPMLHGKPCYDENFKPNFKYIDKAVELTKEEKETLFPPIQLQPTEQDLINADVYMQLALLQTQNPSVVLYGVSPRYELLKKYYDLGIYNNDNLKVFVTCGWITDEEYNNIIL